MTYECTLGQTHIICNVVLEGLNISAPRTAMNVLKSLLYPVPQPCCNWSYDYKDGEGFDDFWCQQPFPLQMTSSRHWAPCCIVKHAAGFLKC